MGGIFSKIDVVKVIGFSIFLFFSTIIAVTVYLVPTIRELKKQERIFSVEAKMYLGQLNEYIDALEENEDLHSKNAKIVNDFHATLMPSALNTVLQKYFDKFDMQRSGVQNDREGYYFQDYAVVATFKDTKKIFSFFNEIQNINNVAKVSMPLSLYVEKNGNVGTNFSLRVYFVKEVKKSAS